MEHSENNVKISVIIPIYKVEEYIEKCILSVLKQTYKSFEIIIVDDCSPDNSFFIALELLSNQNSIPYQYINHKINKGLSEARNSAIAIAKGDYLFFLDSDDSLPANALSSLANCINEYSFDLIYGRVQKCYADYVVSSESYGCKNLFSKKMIQSMYSRGLLSPMACNKLISRSFLMNNHLYFTPNILHEDELWSFRLMSSVNNVALSNDITYHYLMRSNSIMHSFTEKNIESMIFLLRNILLDFKDSSDNKELYGKLLYLYYLLLDMVYTLNESLKYKSDLISLHQEISKFSSFSNAKLLIFSLLFGLPFPIIHFVFKTKYAKL